MVTQCNDRKLNFPWGARVGWGGVGVQGFVVIVESCETLLMLPPATGCYNKLGLI